MKSLPKSTRSSRGCLPIQRPTSKTEEFGLKDQFRRSVTSISINISEGAAKSTNKHFKTYLEHSLGSSYEVETLMNLSKRLFQLENKQIVMANIEIQKMLVALIRSLKL
ncbi:MAG: four helix bundle protein [Bacteroidetes bacterium]|nr:four helix bundle protein [Bacteroidota bacterium]